MSKSDPLASTSSPRDPDGNALMAAQVWMEAARPRTLAASVAPVVVGTAAAGRIIPWRALAALVVALAVQVGVNFANDYFDGIKGIDSPARIGPRRAVASGMVSAAAMRIAMSIAFGIAAIAGGMLAAAAGWELLLVGAASIVAALAYSGGPRPYASSGLGEVFVFCFFGLVATVGSSYVQIEHIEPVSVAAAVPVGLLATAILIVNNLRDIDTDDAAGKRTLAVRMGRARTKDLFAGCILGAFFALVPIAAVDHSPWPLLAIASVWLALSPLRGVLSDTGVALIRSLVATARLHLAFSLLLGIGLWIS
jgi:1,4-dihydroxy-2-naphthoate polyprenyltransferase